MTTHAPPREAAPSAALAIRPGQEMWTEKQRAALAAIGVKGASPGDLAVYMHYCQKTGLDPFSKQIYFIGRQSKERWMENGRWVEAWVTKWTIQVGIDGFRVIRDRIATKLGVSVEYEDTIWYDAAGAGHEVWLSDEPPAACRFAVLKDGRRFPAVVRYSAYVPLRDGKPTGLWGRMDAEQLEKVAEAKALRRAFPNDLGGLYIEEEMAPEDEAPPSRLTAERLTEPGAAHPANGNGAQQQVSTEAAALARMLGEFPLGAPEDVTAFIQWRTGRGVTKLKDLTAEEIIAITGYLSDREREAGGDREKAASDIWADHKAEQDAAAGNGAQEPSE